MWEWLHPSNPDPFLKNDLREEFVLEILQPFDFEILFFVLDLFCWRVCCLDGRVFALRPRRWNDCIDTIPLYAL
jgi:hypothetical protein